MARLFYVIRSNPVLKRGVWMQKFDDGFQQVEVGQKDGHLEVLRTKGLVYPAESVEKYLLPVGGKFSRETLVGILA